MTLSFVLLESPFISVSTVSRGHPALVSLRKTVEEKRLTVLDPLKGKSINIITKK